MDTWGEYLAEVAHYLAARYRRRRRLPCGCKEGRQHTCLSGIMLRMIEQAIAARGYEVWREIREIEVTVDYRNGAYDVDFR